jgi:hypothetical protein
VKQQDAAVLVGKKALAPKGTNPVEDRDVAVLQAGVETEKE